MSQRWIYRGPCLGSGCPKQEKNYLWHHSTDNEIIFIKSNAEMECSIGHSACILDWSFKCIYHNYYLEFNTRKFINAMQAIAGNSTISDNDFTILFMKINDIYHERLTRGYI